MKAGDLYKLRSKEVVTLLNGDKIKRAMPYRPLVYSTAEECFLQRKRWVPLSCGEARSVIENLGYEKTMSFLQPNIPFVILRIVGWKPMDRQQNDIPAYRDLNFVCADNYVSMYKILFKENIWHVHSPFEDYFEIMFEKISL